MGLTQEIKEHYKINVHQIIEQYRYDLIRTQFEISMDTLDVDDVWDYEDELGEIFDSIISNRWVVSLK